MARSWRVHVPAETEGPGSVVDLERGEAHHVHRVLRLRAGESLVAFDGCGREWSAELTGSSAERVTVRIGAETTGPPVEPPVELVLFQGNCRPDRMEWVIQKAVEIGVAAIRPFHAGRSGLSRLSDNRLRRWRSIALEACKQSGRRRLPEVRPCEGLPGTGGEVGLLLDTGTGAVGLARALDGPAPERVWIAVGPEGGFSEEEVERHRSEGWQAVGLGPRTLRTETAGIAAATVVLHRWGDLGS